MQFLSLEPFIPSGSNFDGAKAFFQELGFTMRWDAGDYTGFDKDGCRFILQNFNNRSFAANLMISVSVKNVEALWNEIQEKQLAQRFGIRLGNPTVQPYGKEVNLIDMAGVCWHFVEQ